MTRCIHNGFSAYTCIPLEIERGQRLSLQPQRSYGNLKDEDRIFTNLYGRHDWKLKGALSRVC